MLTVTETINADKINLNGAVMVSGSISGAATIQVKDNIKVGNYLTIGDRFDGEYEIIFGDSAKGMTIRGDIDDSIVLSAINGVSVPAGYLFIDGRSVLLTNTSGMRLDWNGACGDRLYVRTESGQVGFIKIKA
ncbi:hypothetical protein [Lysinibacillus pakistanensis]|uniref:Uncharacterized protein n=1 Tax=Lysinibacillus pakistanensis TaxID=759811 RepID=A0ABX6DAT5_9BACI|nr:hypothetical protein GDS87_13285 [Lysinibacillus pakistanensis]